MRYLAALSALSLGTLAALVVAHPLAAQTSTARASTARRAPRDTVKADYSAPAGAPYTAENVTVQTPMGHTLAGTLTLPAGASREHPVPAIVTATGSGPEDRDEYIGIPGYRPFRQIADSLGRRGIAVLRMDDRGYGQSTGTHKGSTSADFSEDIRAGLAYLRTRPEIDATRLGLLGHSEGGIIAPLAALKEPDLRALVILAGPSRKGRGILEYQMRNLAMNNPRISAAQRDSAIERIPSTIDSLAKTDPWMAYFFDYDPIATARQLNKVPVLILNGSTDQQVTSDQVRELANAFVAGGNKDVTARTFGNLNHLFIYDPSGFPMGYATLSRRAVEPEVVGLVADWLVSRLR